MIENRWIFKDFVMHDGLICLDYITYCHLYMCQISLLHFFMLSATLFILEGDDSALDEHVS